MALKAAFVFIAPNADPKVHRTQIDTQDVTLITVGVDSYKSAVEASVSLVGEGVAAIELCGGFGHKGTQMIAEAVKGKAAVGTVRFDIHPGLGNKSGDELF